MISSISFGPLNDENGKRARDLQRIDFFFFSYLKLLHKKEMGNKRRRLRAEECCSVSEKEKAAEVKKV